MTSSCASTTRTGTGAPLAGVRVLDLTRLLPGPMGTLHLADLGADVIKIEDTGAGDYATPSVRALVNRNKRAIRIDLKQREGVAALLRLCRDADVLVEGFRPGVMQRLGVGYEAVAALNPRIVYCSISGFGQSGPLHEMPGHDLNYAALTGVADQVGNAAGPALSNLPLADLLGGTMTAVMGILAALFDAARSGRGRHVDVAIADGVLAHAVLPLASLHQQGQVPALGQASLTGALACYGFYRTADDRRLAVGALEPKFWQALCQRLERADLAPLHRSGDAATEERLRAELAAIFAAKPLAHAGASTLPCPRHAGRGQRRRARAIGMPREDDGLRAGHAAAGAAAWRAHRCHPRAGRVRQRRDRVAARGRRRSLIRALPRMRRAAAAFQ
jgi:alpha-methylacyl-CoA racemase